MKIKKQCPECGGTEIFVTRSVETKAQSLDLLPQIGGMLFNRAHFEVYVCGTCGFYQMFVPEEWLDEVRNKYEFLP